MKTSKRILQVASLTMALAASAMTLTAADSAELSVATYGGAYMDAVKQAYWQPFTTATGTNVIGSTTEDSMGVLRALATASPSKWDVMETDVVTAIEACNEGLILPLDKSKLPVADLLPHTLQECAVASASVAVALVVARGKFGSDEPKTWQDFWDTKRFPGKRGMARYIQNVATVVLLADGVPREKISEELRKPNARDRIFRKLSEIKGDLVFLDTGAEFVQGLISGTYDMALGWNARVDTANKESGGKFGIVWSAGYSLGLNAYIIPKTTGQPQAAMDYISFVAAPQVEADFMRLFPYGTANLKAYALVTPEVSAKLPSSPENLPYAVSDDYDFWGSHYAEWQEAFEAWIAAK